MASQMWTLLQTYDGHGKPGMEMRRMYSVAPILNNTTVMQNRNYKQTK